MSLTELDFEMYDKAHEKALEKRDNKPVLKFDFEKYVVHQVHSYECGELDNTDLIERICIAVDMMEHEETLAKKIMDLEDQLKPLVNRQNACTLELRKLMIFKE